ncbi:phosphatidylinositol N-acetylglucosaminyltransferase subunit Q [Epargyreus clarus]|uniref:phosphatidylinositol N-acetylglucosaminyltransferase subunit Q n=1 Tax=Epargyreus clarus TaxID=520877 RepID=UPI003C2D3F20
MPSIRILLPVFPNDIRDIFFKGYVVTSEDSVLVTIFVTQFSTANEILTGTDENDTILHGVCSDSPHKKKNKRCTERHCLILNKETHLNINKLIINGCEINTVESDIIILLYDHDKVMYSETLSASDDYFYKLQSLIQKDCKMPVSSTTYKPALNNPDWLTSSMFLQHICNYLNILSWLLGAFKRKEKISIKQGNLILAILVDIILGYLMLQLFLYDKKYVGNLLLGMLEKLVYLMHTLLKWLMGAPAGLKLNNAFNKMLGKYFSYHVELWWMFLDVTSEKLDIILHIYQYLGYLGLTFQAAMISDMICLATFHSYCIYVYAARLFNIQMSGLTALLRLFVGRKYNPLRGGIDSCEYTNQELFVGTVAFTILLLLLPTTLMYYIVFTMFRVLSLLVQYTLAKLIYLVHTLPLYVITLWVSRSSKVAGNILVEVMDSEGASPLRLRVKLFSKSFQDLIYFFKPPIELSKHVEWTCVISNVFTGKQIM